MQLQSNYNVTVPIRDLGISVTLTFGDPSPDELVPMGCCPVMEISSSSWGYPKMLGLFHGKSYRSK